MAKGDRSIVGKIDPSILRAVDALVKEVTLDKMVEEGTGDNKKLVPKYSLVDVLRVIDRRTKLEQIRLKADDEGYGGAYKSHGDDE